MTEDFFQNIQDLSFIPDHKLELIKEFGRVNKPNQSMFYASTNENTACIETFSKGLNMRKLLKKKKLFIAVGVWHIEKPLALAQMISPIKYLNTLNNTETITAQKKENIIANNEYIRKLISNEEQYKIWNFFSEEFAKNEITNHNDYKLSNYFADRVFNKNKQFNIKTNIDGVYYPSVASNYQETNIVLLPKIVNTKLKFLWANMIWVSYLENENKIVFSYLVQNAKAINNKIEWNFRPFAKTTPIL